MPKTTIIKSDRITFAPLTTDPATVVAGDAWFRQDLGRSKWAIDTVVANAKEMITTPVVTADLGDLAVTTAKLADSAVATAKLVDGAVSSAKLADSAVATAKIADSAVTETKIADAAVSSGKIADSAVATAKIVDGAVTSGKIATGAVGTTQLADSAVTDAKVATGISPGKIGTGNLNLGTGTLTAGEVSVSDLSLQHGWRITETPDALLFVKDGKVVGKVSKAGFVKV